MTSKTTHHSGLYSSERRTGAFLILLVTVTIATRLLAADLSLPGQPEATAKLTEAELLRKFQAIRPPPGVQDGESRVAVSHFYTYDSFLRGGPNSRVREKNQGFAIYQIDGLPVVLVPSKDIWLTTNAFGGFVSNEVIYAYLGIKTNYGVKPVADSVAVARDHTPSMDPNIVIREEDAKAGRHTEQRLREDLLKERAVKLTKEMTTKEVIGVMGAPDQVVVKEAAPPNEEGLTFMMRNVSLEELPGREAESVLIYSPWPDYEQSFGRLRRLGYKTLTIVFDQQGRATVWSWTN